MCTTNIVNLRLSPHKYKDGTEYIHALLTEKIIPMQNFGYNSSRHSTVSTRYSDKGV